MTQQNINCDCDCEEFEFIIEPDETGAIIKHKKCDTLQFVTGENLAEFKKLFPDTRVRQKTAIATVPETDKQLITVLEEYIKLLSDELEEVVTFAAMHGWKSTRFQRGEELRNKIATLKTSV